MSFTVSDQCKWDLCCSEQAIIKRNEAVSIQRTYEQILVRLGDECSAFDSQIKAMDDVLSAKKSDVAHLTQISLDAQRARELAKQELQKVMTQSLKLKRCVH